MSGKGKSAPAAGGAAKPKKTAAEVLKGGNFLKLKDPKKKATELETKVNTMLGVITSSKEAKDELKDMKGLTFCSAKEMPAATGADGKRAIVILVEPPLLPRFRALHKPLVDALEKKLDANVLIMANRTMVDGSTWARGKKFNGVRPRNRTLKQVQEAMLEDLVYPCEIIGKRTKIQMADQSRRITVELSGRDKSHLQEKVPTISSVYKSLTSKVVDIHFPETEKGHRA